MPVNTYKVPKDKQPISKEIEEEPVVEEIQPKVTINTTKIVQSMIDAHFIYTGRISGQQYEWTVGGARVSVDERDVPELLSKRLGGNTCCGSDAGGNRIFEIVGDSV